MSDPSVEKAVEDALKVASSKFGNKALSDPTIIEGVGEDRLADYPKERYVLVTAARANVAGLLEQQVPSVGIASAVKLTADSLVTKYSLEPESSMWVTCQIAKALGYDVSSVPMTPAAQVPADQNPAQSTILPTAPVSETPFVSPGLNQPTIGPSFGPSTGISPGPTYPPAAGQYAQGIPPQPTQGAGTFSGSVQSDVQQPYLQQPYATATAYTGIQTAKKSSRNPVVIIIGVIAILIGAYLIVASTEHLVPFAKTTTTSLPTTSTTLNTPLNRLNSYIPQTLSSAGQCAKGSTEQSGAIVSVQCDLTAAGGSIPAQGVFYFLFKDNTALYSYYNYLLTKYSVTQNQIPCGQFTSYVQNCEEQYSVNSQNQGRVTEVTYQGHPFIIATVERQHIVVACFGASTATANNLITWWSSTGNWDTAF
jgi:hypothetical protein